jgi:hypothetical protein
VTGAFMLALIGNCFQVPQKKITEQARMMMLDRIMQMIRPRRERNITTVSIPR